MILFALETWMLLKELYIDFDLEYETFMYMDYFVINEWE